MLVLANFVIHNPYLKICAAYLIRLAFENLGEPEPWWRRTGQSQENGG